METYLLQVANTQLVTKKFLKRDCNTTNDISSFPTVIIILPRLAFFLSYAELLPNACTCWVPKLSCIKSEVLSPAVYKSSRSSRCLLPSGQQHRTGASPTAHKAQLLALVAVPGSAVDV